MNLPIVEELFDAGVHIGHQVRRWNTRFREYLYDNRHGISIIDLEKTLIQLEKACAFVEHIVGEGQDIWFVGTKPQAQEIIRETARAVSMPFVSVRWLGGTLTNFSTIYEGLEKYRRFLAMEQRGDIERMPNKEAASLRRKMARMKENFEGLLEIDGLPAAIFVADVNFESTAAKEARKVGIALAAIVDTDSDPNVANYPVPANDDSTRSLAIIIKAFGDAVGRGLEARELRRVDKSPPGDDGFQEIEQQENDSAVTLSAMAQMTVDALGEERLAKEEA